MGRLRRHSRDAVSRRSARARRRARRRQGRRRSRLGAGRSTTASPDAPQPLYDGGQVDGERVRAGAMGSAAARHATCGRRCRPCAAARSTARSARCGAPTARSRGSARVDRVVARDRRAAAARLPVHRARRRQLLSGDARRSRAGARAARTRRGCTSSKALRARALRADGAARRSCPTTWCSSRRSRWKRPRIRSSSTR